MITQGRLTIDEKLDQLILMGSIDETAEVMKLLDHAKGGMLNLDLGGVGFINSLGVRDWIRMQAVATQKKIAIELRHVSEPIVHQLNMIIATRGTATVASFFAPYACDACGREDSILVDAKLHGESLKRLAPPPATCRECGAQMVFNDFPERYFTFVNDPGES